MNLLAKITNQELEFRLKDLVHKERKLLYIILEHINEVEMRKLYLQRAYSSMYEYLTKELGYSGSAAMRRLQAARLMRDVPVVASKITTPLAYARSRLHELVLGRVYNFFLTQVHLRSYEHADIQYQDRL